MAVNCFYGVLTYFLSVLCDWANFLLNTKWWGMTLLRIKDCRVGKLEWYMLGADLQGVGLGIRDITLSVPTARWRINHKFILTFLYGVNALCHYGG